MILTLLTKRYPGFRTWLVQRLTGLVMAIFSVALLIKLLLAQPTDFVSWQLFFKPVSWRIVCVLFWLTLSVHAWLGIRDVLKDYVPHAVIRGIASKLCLTLIWGYTAWAIWLFSTI